MADKRFEKKHPNTEKLQKEEKTIKIVKWVITGLTALGSLAAAIGTAVGSHKDHKA